MDFDENMYDFLIHQLDLFKALTYVSIVMAIGLEPHFAETNFEQKLN